MTDAKSPTPSPISWAPSQWWDGVDGEWSSFDLRVGTPETLVRVLPSTAGSATWTILPGGCEGQSSNCSTARGGVYNYNESTTWNELGPATLALELNLGHNQSGLAGLETLSLGLNNASGGPTLDSQITYGIETRAWYNGIFGLHPQPMYLSDFDNSYPSFLSTLRSQNRIPSLSWAYTAGAKYRSKGIFGSLTLGGSDTSRYHPTNVSFNLAPDVQRDILVGIQSITSTFVNGSVNSLLPSPTLAFIDSTVPYLYLPVDACEAFESAFGLTWNEKNNIYPVDAAKRQELSNANPQFTFRLGNDKLSEPSVEITLPYASFDQIANKPLAPRDGYPYFPIKRGNDSQITLGRAFLQEAYLIADYDNKNFTIAQARFDESAQPNIVSIPWNATESSHTGRGLSRQATIGISTGLAIFGLLTILLIAFFTLRWRRRRAMTPAMDTKSGNDDSHEKDSQGKVEIPYSERHEMGHKDVLELHDQEYWPEILNEKTASGSDNVLNEMSDGTNANRHELLGATTNLSDEKPSPFEMDSTGPTEYFELAVSGQSSIQSPTHISSSSRRPSSLSKTPSSPLKSPSNYPVTKSQHESISSISPNRSPRTAPTSPITSPISPNIHKELPHEPPTVDWRTGTPPSSRSSSSLLVPGGHHQFQREPSAHRHVATAGKPQMPARSTYATAFDVEEYKRRNGASEKHSGSF